MHHTRTHQSIVPHGTYEFVDKTQPNRNKARFRQLYGRKPTRAEIKLLRKGQIDLNEHVTYNCTIIG